MSKKYRRRLHDRFDLKRSFSKGDLVHSYYASQWVGQVVAVTNSKTWVSYDPWTREAEYPDERQRLSATWVWPIKNHKIIRRLGTNCCLVQMILDHRLNPMRVPRYMVLHPAWLVPATEKEKKLVEVSRETVTNIRHVYNANPPQVELLFQTGNPIREIFKDAGDGFTVISLQEKDWHRFCPAHVGELGMLARHFNQGKEIEFPYVLRQYPCEI